MNWSECGYVDVHYVKISLISTALEGRSVFKYTISDEIYIGTRNMSLMNELCFDEYQPAGRYYLHIFPISVYILPLHPYHTIRCLYMEATSVELVV